MKDINCMLEYPIEIMVEMCEKIEINSNNNDRNDNNNMDCDEKMMDVCDESEKFNCENHDTPNMTEIQIKISELLQSKLKWIENKRGGQCVPACVCVCLKGIKSTVC